MGLPIASHDTASLRVEERIATRCRPRTFFRYFADKREVLFWGSEALEELFVTEVGAAPESAALLDAVAVALDAAAASFEQWREGAARRQQIIAANPELQERELMLASLAAAVGQAPSPVGTGDLSGLVWRVPHDWEPLTPAGSDAATGAAAVFPTGSRLLANEMVGVVMDHVAPILLHRQLHGPLP